MYIYIRTSDCFFNSNGRVHQVADTTSPGMSDIRNVSGSAGPESEVIKEKQYEIVDNYSVEEGDVSTTSIALEDVHAYNDHGYHRQLSIKQVTMITFGAGIGTGFFIGSGVALLKAGPLGLVLAYTIMATMVYLMYMSVGEMTAYMPVPGGFIKQMALYMDPAWAVALGINFWFDWVIVLPAEVTAALSICRFWDTDYKVPDAAYLSIFLVVLIVGNLFPVRVYGYIEYVQSFMKLFVITGLLIFLFVATCGGVPGSEYHKGRIFFQYWKNPGLFNYGFKGVLSAFVQAGFSFGGGEHIATLAGESKNPRKTVKSCITPVFLRMCLFFVGNMWLITMNVPYNDPHLANGSGTLKSPFVIATIRALGEGNPLASIINAFILLTVISCGNAGIYIASRNLVALSDMNLISKFWGRKDAQGRPYVALTVTIVIGVALTYINLSDTGVTVYGWFSSLVSMANYITWFSIMAALIRFRKGLAAQGIDYKTLPFVNSIAPHAQWVGCVIIVLIIIGQGYLALFPIHEKPSAKNFFASYLSVPLFFFNYVGYKWWYKTKWIKPEEMDFSEAAYFDALDKIEEKKEKKNSHSKVTWKTPLEGLYRYFLT